jgi:prophage regulatory protein
MTDLTTPNGEQEDEIWFVPKLSQVTGIPESTFRWWATQAPEKGPPSFCLGRRRVYRRSAVLAWIQEQERKTSNRNAS